jgi:predicted dehydrogenase
VAADWAAANCCERSYDDYRAMVGEHELDGVLLATWPTLHREQILGCLEAGVRYILCEKSLATSGQETLEIFGAARDSGAVVVEGFMYRHHPALQTIERLLESGDVGEVDCVRASFSLLDPEASRPDDPLRDWRQRLECGGGVPYDLACYCVDACNHLIGRLPRRALAYGATSRRYGTVNRLYGLVEYAEGPVGIVASSTRSDFDHELRISGELGHIVLPVAWRIEGATCVRVRRSVGWGVFDEEELPVDFVDPFQAQLERFADVVRGQAEPAPALAESVVTGLTLEALVRSALERTPVDVEIPEDVRARLAQRAAPSPAG